MVSSVLYIPLLLANQMMLPARLDPIFFLHHAQVDRIWWLWQQESPSRLYDYAGNLYPEPSTGMSAALTDIMPMLDLAADRTVEDFMDAGNAELCYVY